MSEPSYIWSLIKLLLAMVVVLALAVLFIKYLLPRFFWGKIKQNSRIKILERVGLEPRKALYIVEVGSKRALVGTSDQRIEKIFDLEESDLK